MSSADLDSACSKDDVPNSSVNMETISGSMNDGSHEMSNTEFSAKRISRPVKHIQINPRLKSYD